MVIMIIDAGVDWNEDEDTEKIFREVIVNEKREKWMNWKQIKELLIEVADTAKKNAEEKVVDEILNDILAEVVWKGMAGEMTEIFLTDGRMKEEVMSRVAGAQEQAGQSFQTGE